MIEATLLWAFVVLTLGILVVPGPDVLYVMARSLGQGQRAGLYSVLGIGAGVTVHTFLAAFGLSHLFRLVPAAYTVLKFAGAAYLLYLAWHVLRAPSERVLVGVKRPDSAARLFGQAFLTNLLNPKAVLFFIAILPQFADQGGENLFAEFLFLGLLVVMMSIAVNAIYALIATHVASWFQGHSRAENVRRWISASALAAVALMAARAVLPTEP